MAGPADAFVMYWEKGRSKINKPWNRQGGGHIICSAYAGGREGVGLENFVILINVSASVECRNPNPPLFIHFQNNSSLFKVVICGKYKNLNKITKI